ncbi:hypothetical protein ABZY90_27815 [Streptomyces sp. NPDC006422]|uniref:hypothetical protein n=1 Tax=unclassified Streptomyces TaxID=2593676 RepID=UPI0033AC6D99
MQEPLRAERHTSSEATRLLSAGAYLDRGFRRAVVGELIGNANRPVAPSLGVDVLTVLAHAVRARSQEVLAALGLLVVWVGFFLVEAEMTDSGSAYFSADAVTSSLDRFTSDPTSLAGLAPYWYATVCAALLLARWFAGRRPVPYAPVERDQQESTLDVARFFGRWRRRLGRFAILWAWINMAAYWVAAFRSIKDDPFPVIFPVAMALVIWIHRTQVEGVLRDELGRDAFLDNPPAIGLPETPRCRRVAEAIAREQHAHGALYDAHLPFVGAGVPYQPWSFALELKPDERADGKASVPAQAGEEKHHELTASRVVALVAEPLQRLRDAAAEHSVDRLRDLDIEEFVYLPAGVDRAAGFFPAHPGDDGIDQHIRSAVDEGGEGRRHFLRLRVGAWDEQVVVTVFVRIHTQGRMLVLEVAPHVLGPVREEFRDVDAVVGPLGPFDVVRGALKALFLAPTAMFALGWSAGRTVTEAARTVWEAPERRAPGAPVKSVREMGGSGELSLFQEMDVSRYVKTIQDRIASGVRDALERSGYKTDRFEQQIVNVNEGGLFIKDMSGGYAVGTVSGRAVAVGDNSRATGTAGEQG